MSDDKVTLVVAVNDQQVLSQNLLRSPPVAGGEFAQIVLQRNFTAASLAYNDAIDKAEHDLLVFVHQDVYLPEGWLAKVRTTVCALDRSEPRWGVLGSFGSTRTATGGLGTVYTTGLGFHGNLISEPQPVESLDEIVLVIRKSSGLRFDPTLPHFHMYGTDICLAARDQGRTSYAIPAFCVHNTNQLVDLPAEFYRCYRHVKRQWRQYLPIHTACTTISRFDSELRKRDLRALVSRWLGRARQPSRRIENPTDVLASLPSSELGIRS